jgi:hypothetical protein
MTDREQLLDARIAGELSAVNLGSSGARGYVTPHAARGSRRLAARSSPIERLSSAA